MCEEVKLWVSYPVQLQVLLVFWDKYFEDLTLHASGEFCHLLLIFANSLDPDQAQQNVGPDLDPNCLTLIAFLKEIFEKANFKKKSEEDKNTMKNYAACKELWCPNI